MKLEVQVQVSSYLEKISQVFSSQTRKVLKTFVISSLLPSHTKELDYPIHISGISPSACGLLETSILKMHSEIDKQL